MQKIIGWDIGGAHLKAARAENGQIIAACQIASPLWLGLEELDRAFAQAQAIVGTAPLHGVTMTGELCDAFATRQEGVRGLAEIAERLLAPEQVLFYAGQKGFVEGAQVSEQVQAIGSANFHASARLAGTKISAALLIDMGSTTTDLVPITKGRPSSLGTTDADRLGHGELVYTGLTRTFLMAGPKLVPFYGKWTGLMNEWFADMADVHRILGQLPDRADTMEPPDGREKTIAASRARLARMIGRDASEAEDAAWDRLARFFAEAQMHEIMDAAALILSRGLLPGDAPMIGAGVGRGLIRHLADRLFRPFVDFDDLIDAQPQIRDKASDCAAACAIALIMPSHFS